ncbi:MAG: hypothetical protein ACI9MR_004974 [Myxococcota bacterium]
MATVPSPTARSSRERQFIDPAALTRLKGVQLRARRVVDGVLQGLHRSPHHGASVEFAEHKEYAPGDEIRHVDWKAYARFDKYYVKKYEQETNLQATFVVDASASMDYGADGVLTKFEYASVLTTAFAHLLLRQQDSVGLVKFAGDAVETLPARAQTGHLAHLTRALERTKVKGGTDLDAALRSVVEVAKKRGLIFVLSDFFLSPDRAFTTLKQLAVRGHQITAFHILDGDELTFPFDKMTLFEGMETNRRLLAEPHLVRKDYLKRIAAHQEDIRRRCLDARVKYVPVDTRESPGDLVLSELRSDGRHARGRR